SMGPPAVACRPAPEGPRNSLSTTREPTVGSAARPAGLPRGSGALVPSAVTTSRSGHSAQEASHETPRSPSTPVLVAAPHGGRTGPGTGVLRGARAPGGSRPVLGQPRHHLVPLRAQESAGRVGPDRGAGRRPGRRAGATRAGYGGGTQSAGPPG